MSESEHQCYDETLWGCAACSPRRPGDYCPKCFWNTSTDKHIWWCYRRNEE